jgi:hypothetical protein
VYQLGKSNTDKEIGSNHRQNDICGVVTDPHECRFVQQIFILFDELVNLELALEMSHRVLFPPEIRTLTGMVLQIKCWREAILATALAIFIPCVAPSSILSSMLCVAKLAQKLVTAFVAYDPCCLKLASLFDANSAPGDLLRRL